jgi:hypothetical protein
MKTRATITIDPELHARAKRMAQQRQTSVSGLFEQFLKSSQLEDGISAVDQMIGSASLRDLSPEDVRGQALADKYLKS